MHLTFSERHYISIALKKGSSQTDIANEFDRCQNVISRELKRNSGVYGYCHCIYDYALMYNKSYDVLYMNSRLSLLLISILKSLDYLSPRLTPSVLGNNEIVPYRVHIVIFCIILYLLL